MDWYRLRHTIALLLQRSGQARARYIRKHDIFYHLGEKCMVMSRKIPLYPKLISFGDNVWISSGVTFVTHDVIHRMLNNRVGGGGFKENIGCIDIKDNVFIGSNVTILPNITIGPNTVVGAGALVNKSLREGVYAGIPAKYICSLDELMEKRKQYPQIDIVRDKNGLSQETVEVAWKRFQEIGGSRNE